MSARRWSLRRLLASLLGVVAVLVGGLLLVASLQLHAARVQTTAQDRRSASFLIADNLRQSSNDLTNMVRLHVATGEPRYRDYYDEILAIRAGTAPRPVGYDSSFWDRVLAEGKGFVRYGKPQSLIAQMRVERFTRAEFNALNTALATSNALAERERAVMREVAPRIRRGVDPGYAQDVQAAYERLVDSGYLVEKGRIMRAIRRFTDMVDTRTLRSVRDAGDDIRTLALVQISIIALIAVVGIATMVLLTRFALRPLARLIASTRRIAAGDYAERVDIDAVSDLGHVADAFNDMARAVEADVVARAAAEREAVIAREAAEHANRAKTTFLAAMSHEIRTPMIGVTGMLELLAHTHLTRHQRGMVATAESSARSLLQIIGDVLDFSKIEADKLELAPCTFDLRTLVGAAVDTFVHTASAKGLLLTWNVDERLGPAHFGDPLRLRQVITNLVSNSVKFTEVGGIEVEARVVERGDAVEYVAITVTDTGIGVTPDQQQRLFEEFGQAESSTTRRYGGTGLGLVICRRLALLMGGEVTMDSTPGRGTTMRLALPLPVGDPAEIDPRASSAASSSSGSLGRRAKHSRAVAEKEGSLLLLAEDHPVNRTVITQQLDLVGFHVDVAQDGEEALERYMTGRYALVLTDLNMPRMDGYELAVAIRRHERRTRRERTPVIALSANVMQGEPERTRAAGMDDFMAKPTTVPFLAAKLRQWLPGLTWEAPSPGAGAVDADDQPIDAAALDLLTGGDEPLARAVLDDFLATTEGDLQELRGAIAGQRAEDARRSAHRMKGAALTVGARPMARLAQQIEDATAPDGESDWPAVAVLADRLGDAFATTVAAS